MINTPIHDTQASLVYSLHSLSTHHLAQPLNTFGLLLPHWGMPMGWSLAALPISPLVFGAVVYLVWGDSGVPRISVSTLVDSWKILLFKFPAFFESPEANRALVYKWTSRTRRNGGRNQTEKWKCFYSLKYQLNMLAEICFTLYVVIVT